ncbi:hypothetical protein F5050DRAFT_1715368 [Lentinula boryana]|uniref:Uncharacterized protein n=1 Tax=Lentinula boryana TaxID=40481 RepID=A0ABQ8Q0V2_9AGAR|nr:hypothetical protein F5050DRAFT_1715368 [Lentinula boryana]
MFSTLSPLAGYSTSRFIILVVLGLVSFACAAPLQPEPTPTTTPSLATFTLKPSSSSSSYSSSSSLSSSSSSPSTAIASTSSFVPRTNPEASKNTKYKTFAVSFLDTRSDDNKFIQEPIRQFLELVNIEVSSFIGTPNFLGTSEHNREFHFELIRDGRQEYYGAIGDRNLVIDKVAANKPGYHYDGSGLYGSLTVVGSHGPLAPHTVVFKVEDRKASYLDYAIGTCTSQALFIWNAVALTIGWFCNFDVKNEAERSLGHFSGKHSLVFDQENCGQILMTWPVGTVKKDRVA